MEIEVMRTGTWTDSSGRAHAFRACDLDRIAQLYEERANDAPIVIGHPKTDDPAYGWVESLRRDKDRLVAKVKDVVPQFADLVRQKLYKYVSVSLVGDKLRHVGFLGAVPPAIQGLKPVSFTGESTDAVCIDFSMDALNKTEEGEMEPSMGPRLFRRGNNGGHDPLLRLLVPSMGPRLFRRGNGST